MEFVAELVAWFLDPANWSGRDGIPNRLGEHVFVSAVSLVIAAAIALPLGLLVGHTGRGATLAVNLANVGRAVPSLGIIGIAFPIALALGLGLGLAPAAIALVLLGIPPIVTNTYAGLREVDRELVDAARGMGMRERQLLWRVELPLALPVILAGVRTSAVQIVATATLAAVVAGGTQGHHILQGSALNDHPRVFGAALIVALLAILTELAFGALQRASVSPGLRRSQWARRQPAQVGRGGSLS
jgi:osmoprotectant transport system permease protein